MYFATTAEHSPTRVLPDARSKSAVFGSKARKRLGLRTKHRMCRQTTQDNSIAPTDDDWSMAIRSKRGAIMFVATWLGTAFTFFALGIL